MKTLLHFFLLILSSGVLFGAPSLPLQEMQIALQEISFQIHSHQAEIDLFQERLAKLEGMLERGVDRSQEGRLVRLEKGHETLIGDLKSLKSHLNETNSVLASCQNKLNQIDQQLSSDVKGLKRSLESMVALLQKGEISSSEAYVVKPGDSLGQIALDHKTDIKTLKQLNNLSSDTIFVGQRLALPQ